MQRKWMRLHCDVRHNFKVLSLSFDDRWYYMCFLTLEADGTLAKGAPDDFLAHELKISVAEFAKVRRRLIDADLLDQAGRVKNYKQRQYDDEASAKRSARYREKKAKRRDSSRDKRHDAETETYKKGSVSLRNAKERGRQGELSVPARPCPELTEDEFAASQKVLAQIQGSNGRQDDG